jgi:Flp pilus assembly protein TadG
MKHPESEEGSSLVEFAIVSPILFAMIFGIIEFSLAFYSFNFTAHAAKEAARYAAVRGGHSCEGTPHLSDCNIASPQLQTIVQNMGYPGIDSSNTEVIVTWPDGDNAPGHKVKVNVNYTFPLSVPFWTATQLRTQSTAQMVISN